MGKLGVIVDVYQPDHSVLVGLNLVRPIGVFLSNLIIMSNLLDCTPDHRSELGMK